ncbi:MAG: hypothetical protein Q8K75_01235 [Chlamydiales bacterium]|nr:hypothetical protein [Chlamydiales bacterium]
MGVRLCLLFLCILSFATAAEPPGRGALIITYHTGRNGERLDRVRIRLINEQKAQTMYPKLGTFQDGTGARLKRITIPDLPAGRYAVEFVIPNQDGLFISPPQREVIVSNGEITKIDQGLKPRYAKIKVTAMVPGGEDLPGKPRMRLRDRMGNIEAESQKGELVTNNLLPGKYTVWFDRYMDFIPPEPIELEVTPGAVIGPFERYYKRPDEKSK